MHFGGTDEQAAIFDMAFAFGQDHIAPYAQQWEKDGTIPKSLWPKIAELGLGGIYVSAESGGSGLSRLDSTLVFEALSMACPSVAAFLSIHNMCARMIDQFGSEELRARYLEPAINMEIVFSYCLTEPGSGSDAAALKTSAVETESGFELTGTKAFISGGGYSDAYVVMCRTGEDGPKGVSAIVVDAASTGLSFGGLEDKMGWRSQPTRQVQFDNCPVPTHNLLGELGEGFTYAMKGLDGGRLNIAACSLGAAQAAMEKTLDYMSQREAFGQRIDSFQALRFRLADMETDLQAGRLLLREAAWKHDQGSSRATKHCAMAKKFVTEVGSRVANDCLQLHGGYGYLADYGIEKIVRDLRVHEILEGTNEIMRMVIARDLIGE